VAGLHCGTAEHRVVSKSKVTHLSEATGGLHGPELARTVIRAPQKE